MPSSLDSTILSHIWYVILFVLGLRLLIYLKERKRNEGLCNIPSISAIPIVTSFATRIIRQCRWGDTDEYFLPVLIGLCHLHYEKKMIRIAWARRQFIICFDSTVSENIFRSTCALGKDDIYRIAEPWIGKGLFISEGEKWKNRRKMLTPAFHFQILRDYLLIFNDHSTSLVEKLKKLDGEIIYITKLLQLCTLDIIIESAMGIHHHHTEEYLEYIWAMKHLSSDMTQRITKPWYWIKPIYNLSSTAKKVKKHIEVTREFTRNIIQKRKEKLLEEEESKDIIVDFQTDRDNMKTKKRRILLDLLLYYHLNDSNFTEEDIQEEVNTFTLTGYGTSSIAVSWVLYLLGWYKTIQDKVYEELKNIFGEERDRAITAEDLTEMKYLECVIKESQRLYPILPFVGRHTTGDIEADGYIIPANSSVIISIYSIHHDPNIYPNPEVFDPDRFLLENCSKRHPYAYVPFAAGPRNCIGQRFAIMEMKTILAYILRNFTVCSLDQRDELRFAADIILHPKKRIRLILGKR